MIGILPDLTKTYLLSFITQEQIFEKYLNIPVQTDVLFKSPSILRTTDDNASCGFKYNINGKLRLKDFQGNFHGDCFDLVGRLIGADACNKVGFNIVLDNIAKIFSLHKYSNSKFVNEPIILNEEYFEKVKVKAIIQIKTRQWDKYDIAYWKKYNITLKTLAYFDVYPCEKVWLNKELNYTWRINDPCYAYYFGNGEYKIYFPSRKTLRFLSNTSVLQGKTKLTCGKACIITKSYKDVIAFKTFGIDCVAPSSETNLISREDYNYIRRKYNFIFSLMDYDNTGIKMTCLLRKVYGIEPLLFTEKIWARKKGIKGTKDFTDFLAKFGIIKGQQLIQKIYYKYEAIFDEYENNTYEQLKWIK